MTKLLADDVAFRALESILTEALNDISPAEKPRFDQIRASVLQGQRLPDRGFPGAMEAGLLSVHLLAGTLALVEMYRASKLRQEEMDFEREIRAEWQRLLIDAGMPEELARLIPVKRCADLFKFLRQNVDKKQL